MATGGGLLRTLGPRENMDILDAYSLQTDETYRASCNAVIDRLVKFLQNNVPVGVKEVVKICSATFVHLPDMATAAADLQSLRPNSNLDVFDADYLQTDKEYRASCSAVIDRLVEFLQNNVSVRVKEVVKGGSLGKGTAIRDKSDIDLVLFLSDYHTVRSVKDKMTQRLSTLEKYLGRYGAHTIVGSSDHNGCRIVGRTRFAVQVTVSCHASHITALIFSQLVTYSGSGNEAGRWPTSYILELIAIRKWEDAGRPERFDLKRGLHSFLKAIVNYRELKVVWYKNYDRFYKQHRPPYVIDPANPFNNVIDRCDVWEGVAAYTRDTLKWTLFRGLESTDTSRVW